MDDCQLLGPCDALNWSQKDEIIDIFWAKTGFLGDCDDFLTVFFDALDDGFGTLMMPSQKPGTVQNPIYTPLRGQEVNF